MLHSLTPSQNLNTVAFVHLGSTAVAASKFLLGDGHGVPSLRGPDNSGDKQTLEIRKITSEYDLFRVIVTLVDKMIRKCESQHSCLANIAILQCSLPAELASCCPDTWWTVEQFIAKHSPFPFLSMRTYDVCPNDCCLFHMDLEHLVTCPNCGESRYANPRDPPEIRRPLRTFKYMPLIPRIRRWFSSPTVSKLLEYTYTRVVQPGVVSDTMDGLAFQRLFGEGRGKIPVSKYNLAFSFGVDGNVARESDNYSVTPLLLTCHAFHPLLRNTYDFVLCVGVIRTHTHTHTHTHNTRHTHAHTPRR